MVAMKVLQVAIRFDRPADVGGQAGQAEQGIVFEEVPALDVLGPLAILHYPRVFVVVRDFLVA